MKQLCLMVFAFFSVFSLSTVAVELVPLWHIDGKFSMPESAAYDPKRKQVYVSNVNHYAKDNNGFISRVSADGSHLQRNWISALHSPTGLAVHGDTLYAVDVDALVVIDLNKEEIIERIPAADAEQNPVLNDVAVSPSGEVFVSGSRSRKIYQLTGQTLSVWMHDEQSLKTANGLLVHQNTLLHGGYSWTALNLHSKKADTALTKMGEGLVDIDGITRYEELGFIVTLIDDKRLWLVGPNQSAQTLDDNEVNGIDLHYDAASKTLFVPRVGNSLTAYRLINSSNQ